MEMLRVKLMYDSQPQNKHGFEMEYKMHENYRNKMKNLHLHLKPTKHRKR